MLLYVCSQPDCLPGVQYVFARNQQRAAQEERVYSVKYAFAKHVRYVEGDV